MAQTGDQNRKAPLAHTNASRERPHGSGIQSETRKTISIGPQTAATTTDGPRPATNVSEGLSMIEPTSALEASGRENSSHKFPVPTAAPTYPVASQTPLSTFTTSTATKTVVVSGKSSNSGGGGISSGGIAAAVVVPIVVIGLALIFGLLWLRRRRRRTGHTRDRSSSFGRREKTRGISDGGFGVQEKIYMHGRDGAVLQKNNVDANVYQPVPNHSGSLDRQNIYPEPIVRRNSRSPFRDPSPGNSASNTPPEISQSFLDHMHHDTEDLGTAFARATGDPLTSENMQEHEQRRGPTTTAAHDDDARSVVSSLSSAADFGDANVEEARSAYVARASIGRLERASIVGVSKHSTDQAPQ